MNRVGRTQGYTMVEAMIVLAVTAALFASAVLLISGQQSKAEFQQGIRNIETLFQDTTNDVSTGYYAANNNAFSCTASPGLHANIVSGSQARGTSEGCVFLGKTFQFNPQGAPEKGNFDIHTVVGNKQVNAGGVLQESQNLTDALPTALARGTQAYNSGIPVGLDERELLPGSITVGWVKYTDTAGVSHDVGGFGIFTTFGTVGSGGTVQKGTIYVNLLPIDGVNAPPATFVDNIDNLTAASPVNPPSGIRICLNSGGTEQHVIMTLGGSGRVFGTKTEFRNGNCGSST